jgi:hypothetical protein
LILESNPYRLTRAATWGIAISPGALTGVMVVLLTTDATRGFALRISRENNVIEAVTAGLLLAGGAFGLRVAWRAKARHEGWRVWGFILLFSLAMLVVGMEELAWGQKLFGFDTPAVIEQINQQNELTLHNLPGLHGHSEILWAAFGIGGFLGVFVRRWRAFEKIAAPGVLVPWFVMILAVTLPSVWNEFGSIERRVDLLIDRLDEFVEMLIAMAGCLYLWLSARRLEGAAGHP